MKVAADRMAGSFGDCLRQHIAVKARSRPADSLFAPLPAIHAIKPFADGGNDIVIRIGTRSIHECVADIPGLGESTKYRQHGNRLASIATTLPHERLTTRQILVAESGGGSLIRHFHTSCIDPLAIGNGLFSLSCGSRRILISHGLVSIR